MSNVSGAAADDDLFCEYGRTMRAAQTFEYTVRQLVSLNELLACGTDRPAVEADAEIARFFTRPLAKLAKQLGVDEGFADDLRAAVATRNTLAHEYFITAFLELHVGIARHRDLITTLADARHRYEDLNSRLEAVVNKRHQELGIDPSAFFKSADEMRRDARQWGNVEREATRSQDVTLRPPRLARRGRLAGLTCERLGPQMSPPGDRRAVQRLPGDRYAG